jgi:hypothetical protein
MRTTNDNPARFNRRNFLQLSTAFLLANWFAVSARAATFLGDVPKSPFGAKSTATEVIRDIDLSGKTILITGVT